MFSKNKQNKQRQIKKIDGKEESYLNYATIINYAFYFLFYFPSNKLVKHT